MKRSFFYVFTMLLIVLTLHSCDIFTAENEYPEGKANVRVVHIAPLADTTIHYFHKDDIIFTNLVYGGDNPTITDYQEIPIGRNPDGFLNIDGDTLIERNSVNNRANDMRFFDFKRNFTVFAMHGPGETGNVRIRSMEVEPTPNAEGLVRLRVLHAASAYGPVDIYLAQPGEPISEDNLFDFNVPFNNQGGSAVSAPAEMPLYSAEKPGTYDVKITLNNDANVIFTQQIELGASRNYTMVLYPNADNDNIARVLLLPDN